MRIVTDEADRALAERFCEGHPRGHFLQSMGWAEVKSGWGHETVLAEDGSGRIVGSLSVLIRKIPPFGTLLYCPRGPVCDIHDAQVLRQLRDGAAVLAGRYGAMALRMEPDVPEDDDTFRRVAASLGFAVRDGRDTIQPSSVFRLDLRGRTEEDVFAGFHRKLRYDIRLAQRHGVEVRAGVREDLYAFQKLMEETARRDGFLPRPPGYYQRVWDAMGPAHVELLLAVLDGRVLAGAMPIHYGRRTWYAYGASATAGRWARPGHLLQWEAIRRALARGDDVYDLRGFLEVTDETDPRAGLYRFKKRFGGELVRLMGEVTLAYRPRAYALYRQAERARRAGLHLAVSAGRQLVRRP